MQCYMNFEHDHDQLVRAELAGFNYAQEPDDTDFSRQVVLLDLRKRLVPRRQCKVHLSREIRANPKTLVLKPVLDEVLERLRNGLSIEPYLSKKASGPSERDELLVHWGIHHLHLSPLTSLGVNGYVDRADELLFFRVDAGNAYLIDIVPHGSPALFVREELVRVVDRNWPELHRVVNRAGARLLHQLSPKEIKTLRGKNGNAPVQTDNRIVIPASGTMASGHSLEAVLVADGVAGELRRLQLLIRLNYAKWFGLGPVWVTVLDLIEAREEGYVVFDSASGETKLFEGEP